MEREHIMIKMTLDRWNALLNNGSTLLSELTDEHLQKEIAPNKNRGIYILGHLIAVHDDLIILLGLGDKLFPQLNEPFIKSPDKATLELPTAQDLRAFWKQQNEWLASKINALTPDEWFSKHQAVSAEDFVNEPHRNKLNIIITRTSHLAYHLGQLTLLK